MSRSVGDDPGFAPQENPPRHADQEREPTREAPVSEIRGDAIDPSRPSAHALLGLQRKIGNRAVNALVSRSAATQPQPAAPNRTGLPDSLKRGVEELAGVSIDDVRVSHSSARPAALGALAYTQGTKIHLGPRQEAHLAHEAWHAVQQKQGRVAPTIRHGGVAANNDPSLEREADVMGAKAAQLGKRSGGAPSPQVEGKGGASVSSPGRVVQRVGEGSWVTTEECHLRNKNKGKIAKLAAGVSVTVAEGAATRRFGLPLNAKDHTWVTYAGQEGWVRDDALALAQDAVVGLVPFSETSLSETGSEDEGRAPLEPMTLVEADEVVQLVIDELMKTTEDPSSLQVSVYQKTAEDNRDRAVQNLEQAISTVDDYRLAPLDEEARMAWSELLKHVLGKSGAEHMMIIQGEQAALPVFQLDELSEFIRSHLYKYLFVAEIELPRD